MLDAGCGTGRVGIRLAELGYDVTGVDLDESMLAVARERAPQLRWLVGDLATVDLGEAFDLVLMAGNIVPLVAEGSEPAVVARMAAHVAAGGHLVAGFGLDRAHLPPAAAIVRLDGLRRLVRGGRPAAGPPVLDVGRLGVPRRSGVRRERAHPSGQCSRLTPRAMTITDSSSADTDSAAISSLARCDSGIVSVGLNAEELVVDT